MDKVYRKNPYPQLQYIEFPVWQVLSGKKQFLLFLYVYGKLVTSDKTHVKMYVISVERKKDIFIKKTKYKYEMYGRVPG